MILHPVFRRCWGCLLNILEGLRALADIVSTKKMKSVDTNWAPAKWELKPLSLSEDLTNLSASSKLRTPGCHSATPTHSGQVRCCRENRFWEKRSRNSAITCLLCREGREKEGKVEGSWGRRAWGSTSHSFQMLTEVTPVQEMEAIRQYPVKMEIPKLSLGGC